MPFVNILANIEWITNNEFLVNILTLTYVKS